jgi:hypothetical protein
MGSRIKAISCPWFFGFFAVVLMLGCGGSSNSDGGSSNQSSTPPPQPDFSISIPSSLTVTPNSTQTISISITQENGFSSAVSFTISGLPAGVTATPASFTLSATGGSYSPETVTITASGSATAGMAAMTVTGVSGSISHTLTTSTGSADFALAGPASPASLTAGGTAEISISADALNGFSGQVTTNLSGLPAGVAASPSTLVLVPGTAQTVTLTAASTVGAGSATLVVTGTSGSLTHDLEIPLVLVAEAPADFSLTLSPNPARIALPIGGTGQATVTANAVGAFNSPVNMTVSGVPAGVTATPSSFTLTPGSSQTVVFQASSNAIAGQSSVTFQGSAGTLSHSVSLSLSVTAPAPDFQLFAGPSTLDLSTILDQPFTIALIPLNGFNAPATVTISGLPAGVTLLNQPLPLFANIAQLIELSVNNPSPGQSTITVTATAGTITHTAQIDLVISTPTLDFTPFFSTGAGLLLTPGTFQFDIGLSGAPAGTSVQLSGLVPGTGLDQSQYTFTTGANGVAIPGVFNLTVTSAAVGERGVLSAVFTGAQINHEIDLPIYVVAQPTIFSYIAPLTLSPGSAADLVYEAASTSVNSVELSLGPGWAQNFWLNPYLTDLNPALIDDYVESAGRYSVSAGSQTASGSTTLPFLFTVDAISQTVAVPTQINASTDFQIAAEPTTIALASGATQTVSVSTTALNGSTAPVSVSFDQLPTGLQASPQEFSITPGTTETVTLTAGSNYTGGGVVDISGTSGSVTRSTQVAVSPGSFTGDLAGCDFSALCITTIGTPGDYLDFNGQEFPGGIGAVLGYTAATGLGTPGPYIVSCNSGGCSTVDVELYQGPSAYVVGSIGSDLYDPSLLGAAQPGTLVMDANFGGGDQLAIYPYLNTRPDFTLAFSPASLTIQAGSSASLSITATSTSPTITNYCTGADIFGSSSYQVQLTAPVPLASSAAVSLCPEQSATASVSVPANVPPGNYELTANSTLSAAYRPYYNPGAFENPYATITAGHSYGVEITVTAAPAPSFQLSASPADISVAAGESFPVTVSATGANGFAGSISVTASSLPQGVTISPSTFSVIPGSSQPITISAQAGAASGEITLTGTSGSVANSTQISVTVSP